VSRQGERRLRRRRPPGLDSGKPSFLQLGDDLVGDIVIEITAGAASAGAVLSGHRDDLRDGRRRPLLQPSTRHGKPVRTLPLRGCCGGIPRSKGGVGNAVPTRGKASPPNKPCTRYVAPSLQPGLAAGRTPNGGAATSRYTRSPR